MQRSSEDTSFPPSSVENRARVALAPVRTRARSSIAMRADEIGAVLGVAVEGGSPSEQELRSAQRAAHLIVGSAGTVGMPTVSSLARELEDFLESGLLADPIRLRDAVTVLDRLRSNLAEDAVSVPEVVPPVAQQRREILLAHPDPGVVESLTAAAAMRGWTCRTAADLATARECLRNGRPEVLLVSADLPPQGCLELLDPSGGDGPDCPALVLARAHGAPVRLDDLRRVSDGILADTADPEHIVDVAIHTAGQGRGGRPRLLVLADGPTTLSALSLHLSPRFEVTVVADQAALGESLRRSRPDAFLLDVDTPGVDGPVLCRQVAQDPLSQGIPVLAATARPASEALADVLAAGAEDVIAKPIGGPDLLNRLATALDRAIRCRRVASAGSPTQLAGRGAFEDAFSLLAEHSLRTNRPLALALLDLDHPRDPATVRGGEDHALDHLADYLSICLPEWDVVGRWGGREVLVAMRDASRADGIARVSAVLEVVRGEPLDTSQLTTPPHVTFSGVVAEFPNDGTDLLTLLRGMADSLAEARHEGNRVIPIRLTPPAAETRTDVFIVEDDEVLVSLLKQALETRGIRSEYETDGRTALDRLVGPRPLSARVILLDVDLPGIDGQEILRRLGQEGVLSRSRVVMLTAASSEEDVRTAESNGAFDHVAKPFSLPVLTQRLRRALQDSP